MSSLSIQGVSQALSQFFQNIGSASAAQSTAAPSSTTGQTPSTAATQTPGTGVSGTHHHHRGGGKLFQQIQQAVTSALQNAQTSGSSTDPNQTIQDAISQVLKGIGGTSDDPSAANPLASTSSTTGGTSSTDPTASFFQLLKSNGVNPKQFQQDFLNAIQQAQNGQVNPSSVLQNLPTGSLLDEIG